MRTSCRFLALFAATLLNLAGCDHATSVLPAAPSPPAAPAEPAGQIAVSALQPGSGATLTAEECDGGWCIEDARFTFDVQLDQDVAEPWVTASFYTGSQRCAGTGYPTVSQTIEPLRANTATTFTVSGLGLSDQSGALCALPQTTTRMVVELRGQRGRSATALLTREFTHSYTFMLP